MYKIIYSTVVLVALVPLTGCGQSADDLAQTQIDQLNALADAIESGAEQAEIDAIQQKMKAAKDALDGMQLSDEEKKKLAETHSEEMTKALGRLMKANMSKMGGAMKGMMENMPGQMPPMPEGFGEMPQLP
ncbi:MAG TPA: hypothetical protein VE890_08455 [Thermoguttaceae bacterium]|nr:hypothetical protein [Thermoguttaceae bacterium]